MATNYERVFTPIKIRNVEVKNRLTNSSAVMNYSKRNGALTQREIDFFIEKAKGGLGIVVTAATSINATTAKGFALQAGLHSDEFIPQYKVLTDGIRSYGAKSAIQIYHPGRATHPRYTGGKPSEGPKEKGCPIYSHYPGYEYEVMTTERIKEVIKEFGETALRAKKAGFDIIEVHGAHGYLLTAFSSHFFGKRPIDDEYVGNYADNKLRVHREVLNEIRRQVGEDFAVGIRFNSDDFVDGGNTLEDGKEMARMLEDMGFDYIGVSCAVYTPDATGMHYIAPSMYIPPLHLEFAAAAIKEVVGIPVMQFGRVSSLEVAEGILQRGTADIVQMNRATWADPHIVNKSLRGEEDEIRHCIYCNNGCIDRLFFGLDTTCTMNPECGREREFAEKLKSKVSKAKKVVVIGGGPAGMACARYAKLRGHNVILLEKKNEIGGANLYASKGPRREEFAELTNYYASQIKKLGVEVRLGVDADIERIKELKPDVAVVAAGAAPKIPRINGVRGSDGRLADNVITAWEALGQEKETGDHSVIVGANHIGIQTALLLLNQGKTVTLVECQPALNQDMDGVLAWEGYLKQELKRYEGEGQLEVLLYMYAKKIVQGGIICEPPGSTPNTFDVPGIGSLDAERLIICDTVIVGTGREPLTHIFKMLLGVVPELYNIGDCVNPGWAHTAIREGAEVGISI
jgi:2,4-dienoyl-CoA reductase-like NADH-dependent reductase (Old Yellow Enzyme family)/NADPH-dependent 2,4-dienoyl-CoA reductase/sulfur reductase-like enzyme